MARFVILFILFISGVAYASSASRARTEARFKSQCDNDGAGKACYDYARIVWSKRTSANRKIAMKYFLRGCALKYKLACEAHREHSTKIRQVRHTTARPPRALCFSQGEMNNARFSPNLASPSSVLGQKIDQIRPVSFWSNADLKDGDVIVRVNNQPFNSLEQMLSALGSAGKSFSFVVNRAGGTITLWYNCQ